MAVFSLLNTMLQNTQNGLMGAGSTYQGSRNFEPRWRLDKPEQRLQLLDAPVGQLNSPKKRELDIAYRLYLKAWIAADAVDHPDSIHARLDDDARVLLRESRMATLSGLQATYEELAAEAKNRAQRSEVRKCRERLKNKALTGQFKQQASLWAANWPDEFGYIAERFPRRPSVTNNPERGVVFKPLDQAFAWSHVQFNTPIADHLMIIDYDAPDGLDITDAVVGLATPTWIARTPGSKRGHAVWALDVPVLTSESARLKPMEYLARIEEGYRNHMHGDKGYSGYLTKNPVSDVWDVEWIESKPYKLDDLASFVQIDRYTKKGQKKEIEPYGLGRKVLTFEKARRWAYSAVSQYWGGEYESWLSAVRDHVEEVSSSFDDPIPPSHCKCISKSIARWVWKRFTPLTKHQIVIATHTPAVQAMRGAMKGAKRREELLPKAKEMQANGATQTEIAAALEIKQQTVSNWLRSK